MTLSSGHKFSRSKPKRTPQREAPIQAAILEYLAASGVWAWRVNSGATVVVDGKSRRMIKGAPAGTPDIRIEAPQHLAGYLEVKSPTGALTDTQRIWHERAKAAGVRVAVVRSVKGAMDVLARWDGGKVWPF